MGRLDLSAKILHQLTHNAVAEGRFSDAAYSFWRLSMETAKMGSQAVEKGSATRAQALADFNRVSTKAEIYHAYSMVHKVRGIRPGTTALTVAHSVTLFVSRCPFAH